MVLAVSHVDWSVKKSAVSAFEENLLIVLEVWVSWRVVDDDASGLDIIINTVFRVFHKVDEVLDEANTEEQVVTLRSDAVCVWSKFGTIFDKIIGLRPILIKDGDIITGSDQEESKLMSGFAETNPPDLSLLVVLDDLHAILFCPVWKLEWLSVFHELIPIVFSILVFQLSCSERNILLKIFFLDFFLELQRGCAHSLQRASSSV